MSLKKKIAESKLPMNRGPIESHPADLNYYKDGEFYHVEIDLILPDPNQPRKYFDSETLAELSNSIKNNGVLQPVIIRMEGGKIYLVAGERRYRAAKMANLKSIPAIMTTGNPMEIALIENLQREDLKPIEEAEALGAMIDKYNYTQDKLAFVVGKAKSTISETLSLNKLPKAIKDEVRRAEQYPRRLLVEIAKQESPEHMIEIFNHVKKNNLKSDQLRTITRKKHKKEKRSTIAVFISKVFSLDTHLKKLDLNNIKANDKHQLINAIHTLQNSLEHFIEQHDGR